MAMPATTASGEAPETRVFERAFCLKLSFGKFGNTRKVPSAMINLDADKRRIKVTKKLLECDEIEAIPKFDRSVAALVEAESLPMPLFSGSYVVPVPAFEKVDALLREAEPVRAALVEAAVKVYPDKIREASQALRVVYNPADYATVERFRAMYFFEWRWLRLDTPSTLRQVSPAAFREEREKAARYWAEMLEEGKQMLRETFLELVKHARERLEPGPDGKPKVFRNTLVENLNAFLETFDVRNIADDRELARLVKQMRELTSGANAQDLRSTEALREAWRGEAAKIEAQLASMIVDAPSRRITVE